MVVLCWFHSGCGGFIVVSWRFDDGLVVVL